MINEVINIINPPKNIEIELINKLPTLNFNKIRIYQLFQNLISNALKYNDKEYIKVKLIGTLKNIDEYGLRIADNGMRIESSKLNNIFNPFEGPFKFNSHVLDLANAKKIVHKIEDKITVLSEPSKGTTFIITFPTKFCKF